jgi:hypothetical protein
MISNRRHSLWIAAVLAGVGFPAFAVEFVPPAEGPVAFRRDKVPLDAEAMAALSRQLEMLARGLSPETPADFRGAAQMLALALALDPANARARELVSVYQKGRHEAAGDVERLEKSRARIWQYIAWLETPEAGSQGQALAACLKDVIIISDPTNPKATALREAGEKGAWAGWVPAVSVYEKQAVAATDDPKNPKPEVTPDPQSELLLEQAQVLTLLWQMVGKEETASWVLAPGPLQMTAKKVERTAGDGGETPADGGPLSITVGSGENGGSLAQIGHSIKNLLKKQHENLPRGVSITITSKELERSLESKKRQSISAAAAVLASAAITGRAPGAIIIGQVDETGAFKLPTAFWDQLRALGKGSGQRLILPAEAASYLPSMLALEKPSFFMDYEVMLAADFSQLLELSAGKPEGPLAAAITEFGKIRERLGTQDLRQYIANTFVKQRLMAVLQDAPAHFSSKMLLVQAAGSRPTLVARPVLAAEIRRALEPMEWILRLQDSSSMKSSDMPKLSETYESCRSRVDALERYAEKNDRPLIEMARELVIAVRNLDRASRTRGENNAVQQAVQKAASELKLLARTTNEDLAVAAGDAPSEKDR